MLNIIKQLCNSKAMLNSIETKDCLIEVDEKLRIQLQRILLEMFRDVYRVCQDNNIEIVLVGGSALGAERHKGFIPWDDDLDIGMTRDNYRKFVKIFEKTLGTKYFLCAPNYANNAKTRFPKVLKKNTTMQEVIDSKDFNLQRVFLDIFIIDNVPDGRIHRRIKGMWCNLLEFISGVVFFYENADELTKDIYTRAGVANYLIRMTIGRIFSFFCASKWNDMVDRAIQYNRDSRDVTLATGRKHYFGEILESDKLFPVTYCEFEGELAPVFKDNDYYLRNLYGNYKDIPPIEKRERHFIRRISL